jgi:hypothetical protein
MCIREVTAQAFPVLLVGLDYLLCFVPKDECAACKVDLISLSTCRMTFYMRLRP